MNRGSWMVGLLRQDDALASMRPRFMNRGSAYDQVRGADPVYALQ